NGNTWTDMAPASSPLGRDSPTLTYDSAADRVILFGGTVSGRGDSNETWAYDFRANAWADMARTPPARYGHAMAYDSQSDRIILFGGWTGTQQSNDTWAYDFNANTWTDMAPATSPPGRYLHAMAYDSQSDRVILFGGDGGYNDTGAYEFDAETWTGTPPTATPAPLVRHALAYESAADSVRVIV